MGHFGGLPSRHLFQLWLASLCAMLLMGLVVESLSQPPVAGAAANPAAFMQAHPMPTATATPRRTATSTPNSTATSTPTPNPITTPTPNPTTPRPTAIPHPSPPADPTPAATSVLYTVGTTTATPTAQAGAITGGGSTGREGQGSSRPPWLVQGLVIVVLVLLGFSVLIVPIAVRSARSGRWKGDVSQQTTTRLAAVRIEEDVPSPDSQ